MDIIYLVSMLSGFILAFLGCFVLWRKYIFFTDSFAHASILVVTLAMIEKMPIIYSWIFVIGLFLFLTFFVQNYSDKNTSSALISSIMISVALILSYYFKIKVTLTNIIFGNISSSTQEDLIRLGIIFIINCIFFIFAYNKLLALSLNEDIAKSLGIKSVIWDGSLLLILSLSIVILAKIVGSFFITSLVLIPSMSSRLISHSPIQMLFGSLLIVLVSNIITILTTKFVLEEPYIAILVLVNAMIYLLISGSKFLYTKTKKG